VKLGLVSFISELHQRSSIQQVHADLLNGLSAEFDVSFIGLEELGTVDQAVAFIASGGVEDHFRTVYPHLPRPLLLLADGRNNSLGAAMEILSWIREQGDTSEILHGDVRLIASRLRRLHTIIQTRKKLSGSLIGILGTPSSWLIASHVDPIAAVRRWGVTFRELSWEELTKRRKAVKEDEAVAVATAFTRKARAMREASDKDVLGSARLYLALKALVTEHELSAVTVRCFDLLEEGLSGCLGLSLLNDEGITAGCEGDEQSVFSMLLLRTLTGEVPFMANPVKIAPETNKIILGHCTIATSMTVDYVIRNHFESGTGVGIQGELAPGQVTIFKCGRPGLDQFFISGGRLLASHSSEHACRTQLEIVLDESVKYFLQRPLGNHHVMVRGNHVQLLQDFTAGTV